jgi:hypothetical protein
LVSPPRGCSLSSQGSLSPGRTEKNVTINVQAISPEEGVGRARDVLQLFGSNAEPRSELPAPLIESESGISATDAWAAKANNDNSEISMKVHKPRMRTFINFSQFEHSM